VRGDRNTPYTPFSRHQDVTPQFSYGHVQKRTESKKPVNINGDDEMTPVQFLRTAQQVGT